MRPAAPGPDGRLWPLRADGSSCSGLFGDFQRGRLAKPLNSPDEGVWIRNPPPGAPRDPQERDAKNNRPKAVLIRLFPGFFIRRAGPALEHDPQAASASHRRLWRAENRPLKADHFYRLRSAGPGKIAQHLGRLGINGVTNPVSTVHTKIRLTPLDIIVAHITIARRWLRNKSITCYNISVQFIVSYDLPLPILVLYFSCSSKRLPPHGSPGRAADRSDG
jgi:hypothetical protein